MTENIKIDVIALQVFVAQYKATFAEHRLGADYEIYKWKAVKCFQDHWDIEAPDFLAMLKSALAQTGNLLANVNNFPKGMLEAFAEIKPEEVRAMFRELFDENADVAARAKKFAERASALRQLNPAWKQDYQTPNAISTYLWLRYPDKYYIYKYSIIKDNAQRLCGIDLPTGKLDRMVFGFALYDAIRDELVKDSELVSMSKNSLTPDAYPDDALKTLTIDVGYFIGKRAADSPPLNVPGAMKAKAKNIILYGAPGTGKTYSSVLYAVSIIEEKPLEAVKAEEYSAVFARYLNHKDAGLVVFTTFHQSFGYEEFIEGIRPVVASDDSSNGSGDIKYEVRDGIFKAFCDKAGTPVDTGKDAGLGIGKSPSVWKVSLEGTGDNPTRKDCMDNGYIRIAWEHLGEDISIYESGGKSILDSFYNRMQIGDLVFSCYSYRTIDAIGVITGDPEWREDFKGYKRVRKVRWLVKGLDRDIYDLNNGKTMTQPTVYNLKISATDAIALLREVAPKLFTQTIKIPNRVFIIDEINRGNISKIFGELITLIEPAKRIGASEGFRAKLPYSGQDFGVPENVFIIGTMNTADRSIAMIDTALRRRFSFVEMQPDSSLLRDVVVEGIDIAEMLDTMNRRIKVLFDREHAIGHSYLLPLKADASVEMLAEIFESKILPLLQEYFYDDYEKIQLVLGDNQKRDDGIRFVVKNNDAVKLFNNEELAYPEFFEVNKEAFKRIEAYAFLN